VPEEYELWRDFDWEKYIRLRSELCPNDAERAELREAVRVAREFLRIFIRSKLSRDDVRKVLRIQKTTRPEIFAHALTILAQIANVQCASKREANHKLGFATTAISHAAGYCKQKRFDKVLPVLNRFVEEF
jgi:hypothetical protein